jgi:hypothetical protein
MLDSLRYLHALFPLGRIAAKATAAWALTGSESRSSPQAFAQLTRIIQTHPNALPESHGLQAAVLVTCRNRFFVQTSRSETNRHIKS